ncbi:MAG: sigma-54-dependent Fis family transcriptional regulator [Bacteriovoracaceae bacterium]|nr:sigma-54-dependent Fis family transcriptional regulator [Bacteriovoracaceae bacterium]
MKCIIVEDENLPRLTLRGLLKDVETTEAKTLAQARALILNEKFDLAFLDLDLDKKLAGLELTKIAKERGLYSIIVTGHSDEKIVERAYQLGCQDYLTKPITQKSLDLVLKRFNAFDSETRIQSLIETNYITTHAATLNELNIIKKIGLTDKPVLIKGPSGTGKRIVAHIIRDALKILKDKFIEINCAQFSDNLLESELFGHKKGSFTGATEDKLGLLAKADNGIIFLDEIHALSKSAQQKLMKAIEEKEFYPVGSTKIVKSNFRVICATCEDLLDMVATKKFRADFYARMSGLQIQLYGLSERKEDIIPIINFYLDKFARRISITKEAKDLLIGLDWKNNVRDIETLVEYWQIHGNGIITEKQIPEQFRNQVSNKTTSNVTKQNIRLAQELGLKDYLDLVKSQIIESVIEASDGNRNEAARRLKISKQLLSHYQNKPSSKEIFQTNHGGLYETRLQ